MTTPLTCPKCGSDDIYSVQLSPCYFQCRACKKWLGGSHLTPEGERPIGYKCYHDFIRGKCIRCGVSE